MTFSRRLLTCLALSTATTMTFASTHKKPAPPSTTPTANVASTNALAATPPAPAAPTVTLDDYMKDLKSELNLSASEQQEIQSYYVADGAQMQTILNDDTLSSLQKYQQVSDLRDARNAKIKAMLNDLDRQQTFANIESKYRVTLTLLAANGQLVAAAPQPNAK